MARLVSPATLAPTAARHLGIGLTDAQFADFIPAGPRMLLQARKRSS